MTSLQNEPAFVLHRRQMGETSLVVDFFTRHHGRVSAYARGARKQKNKSSSVLSAFTPLLVSSRGRGRLKSLVSADAIAPPFNLAGNNLYCGLYLNELIVRILPEADPQEAVFNYYMELLGRLGANDCPVLVSLEYFLRKFEWMLVEASGCGFSLQHDAIEGGDVQAQAHYQFRPGLGLVLADAGSPDVIAGKTLLDFMSGQFTVERSRLEMKYFMRRVLRPLLGTKPLASRNLFSKS